MKTKKPRNYIKNLGKYAHPPSKLPDKSKRIGSTKLKLSNQKNKLGSTTVVTTRKRIRKMMAQKEI
jgi:hypothetical protein